MRSIQPSMQHSVLDPALYSAPPPPLDSPIDPTIDSNIDPSPYFLVIFNACCVCSGVSPAFSGSTFTATSHSVLSGT